MFLKCLLMQLVILFQNCFDYLPQNHMLLNLLLVSTLYQFVLLSKPTELKHLFDEIHFPLFHKHCYLTSFQVLLTLPLHNISGCLYKSPQFHFCCVRLWSGFHYLLDCIHYFQLSCQLLLHHEHY